jgi:hypothetical protein
MKSPSIPPRTRMELANPAAQGSRHEQARRVIFSLVAQGFSGDAVFAQVRGIYAADFLDAEIWSLIRGAERKAPKHCGYAARPYHNSPSLRRAPITVASATAAVERFLKGFRCDEADLYHASPWRPLEDPEFDALPILAGLFHTDELVNVCVEHGLGITKTRDDWMRSIRDKGVPSGSIGCMFRPNPMSATPSGDKGGWTDVDVTAHRFAVLESDILPLELQLAVIARLPLPIAAIIFSGGKSYHALVRVNAPDAVAYRKDVGRMLGLLRQLGFDPQTGNPSRMSRLPGGVRDDQQQRLLYLNPDAGGDSPIIGAKQ